ncbi:MAG: 3-oxoacyl-[acyl-carrier-protein] synthase III C-terminal domain-containing protein [Candidatus Microsaccharimonas sp.]
MNKIRNIEIAGYGVELPERTVTFGEQTRYRVEDGVSQLDLLGAASLKALAMAELEIDEIDCIIGGSAAGYQPLPATATLLKEKIALDTKAAAFDVNSSCTSFITSLDYASRLINDGDYNNILIASGDVASRFLNPKQRESYELFSDAGAAMVIRKSEDESKGVIGSKMRTWSRNAHDTEVRGGLSGFPPEHYASNPEEYLFDMDGRKALLGMVRALPPFFNDFYEQYDLSIDDIDWVIPHQASHALALAMGKLGIPQEKYANYVSDYGNMVSASVPFAFAKKMGEGAIKSGDTVLLCGTAAGLTANLLALKV